MADTQFRVQLVGGDKAKKTLDADFGAVQSAEFLAIQDTTLSAVARAKRSFGQPGRLRWVSRRLSRAIVQSVERRGKSVVGTVGVLTTVPYGAIHEFGGTIVPKRAPFLVFMGREGHLVSVRQVTIPKRPYVRPSVEQEVPFLKPRFQKRLAEALSKRG